MIMHRFPTQVSTAILVSMIGLTTACDRSSKEQCVPCLEKKPPLLQLVGDTNKQLWTWYPNSLKSSEGSASVRIERLARAGNAQALSFPNPLDYHQSHYREGDTTFTITTGYLAKQRVVFQRMRCDQPGELHVCIDLTPHHATLDRELKNDVEPCSQLWLLPFEAEVQTVDNKLVLMGEGEFLMIWHIPGSRSDLASDWRYLLEDFINEESRSQNQHVDLRQLSDRMEVAAKNARKRKSL